MAREDCPAAPIFTSTPLEGPSSGRQTGRKEPRLGGPDEDSIGDGSVRAGSELYCGVNGRQVRAPAVCPQNSVESPRTPPHSRRIVSCACAGPVGRAPTVAKELAESAALSSLASYSAARCTAQLLTRQALIRRAEAIFFGLDQAYQPSGLPRVAQVVTFQLMECADDAIKALFAADGAGLKGKVSKKKALAQLLCDMIARRCCRRTRPSLRARASPHGSSTWARRRRRPRRRRRGRRAAATTLRWRRYWRVVGMLERRGAVYSGFLPEMSTPPPPPPAPPSSPHPATRLAAPLPSRVSPRSGTAKGGHKQHHRYQRHRAGAGELCGPCSGPLARRPGTWRPHTAPRPRLAGQNRRRRVGTLDGAPGLAEGGLGGAGWLGCPPRAVCQASGVGETISGRRGGGSDARSGCWPEDVAGSAILGAPVASSRAERRQLVAGAAGRSGRHRMLVGVGCLGV